MPLHSVWCYDLISGSVVNKRRVDITIQTGFHPFLSQDWIRQAALSALAAAIPHQSCHLGVAVCDDNTIKQLNRDYRGMDAVTDVLSFSTHYSGSWQGEHSHRSDEAFYQEPFVMPVENEEFIGEVVVSFPQMCRQAAESSTSQKKEMAFLVIHGTLHLLGYDHEKPEEKAAMESKEQEAMSKVI